MLKSFWLCLHICYVFWKLSNKFTFSTFDFVISVLFVIYNAHLNIEYIYFICLSLNSQWQGETQEFCPNAKVVLVGCKLDLRTDLNVMRELSKHRLIPVTHEQVRSEPKTLLILLIFLWGHSLALNIFS